MQRLVITLLLSLLAIACAASPARSQDTVDGFVARIFSKSGKTIPYRLFIPPKYKRSGKYPLILWLHGAGGSGTDNLRQIRADQVPGTHLWTTPENITHHPAFVLVPQSARGWTERDLVLDIVDELKEEFSIDPNRIYVIGQSMGGQAAWELVTYHPGIFAAGIFVCAAGTSPNRATSVATLPVWVFHGSNDPQLERTRQMIEAIRNAGGNPRYTEYSGMGHEIWDRVFSEPELPKWLFAQHR